MHLQSIKIRGFKSFVDPIELKLEPGVAVVVGPNGSGKSNVADAIVWAAGSLTPSELRAEKPDDVLFGGAANRAAADHCEVELIFDNEDGGFGDDLYFARSRSRGDSSAAARVSTSSTRPGSAHRSRRIARRRRAWRLDALHRLAGQGRRRARLEAGGSAHLVEEAAGLGKFKRRKHRAELKLARVAIQVERAKDVEEEVRKRLRPLALQATAAERAEKLAIEIAALRARHRAARPRCRDDRRADAEERREAVGIARRAPRNS